MNEKDLIKQLIKKIENLEKEIGKITPSYDKFHKRLISIETIEAVYDNFILKNHVKPQYILVPHMWSIGRPFRGKMEEWTTKNGEYYYNDVPIYKVKGLTDITCVLDQGRKTWMQVASPFYKSHLQKPISNAKFTKK